MEKLMRAQAEVARISKHLVTEGFHPRDAQSKAVSIYVRRQNAQDQGKKQPPPDRP